MPASLKLLEQYGDDIAVLFVESQGASDDKAQAFAWRRKWMGRGAMWTIEPPLRVEGNGLPKYALLDNEGRLISSGNPLADKKSIEEAIAEQVKRRRSAPDGTPAKLVKAWGMHAKGTTGAAIAECDRLAAEDETIAAAAIKLRERMLGDAKVRIARVASLYDNGRADEAATLGTSLGAAVKGSDELQKSLDTELARQRGAGTGEIEAAKALGQIEAKMNKGKPFEEPNVKSLERLAEKHKGTKAAERAARLAALAAVGEG